ncbi:MAG TPA: chemotaxis protein CheW [Oligoflexus sp.]|uniref:chemotaxis protein CheW n=1 Tax=Oligoflexus sp. TaxID=1971216 RepID=UPI002D620DC6|nr:chemotaxis protein CheW [Oligoflexus sp.]HYX33152.1 chemotaxis protein CheW [Oligoflexus sp.]
MVKKQNEREMQDQDFDEDEDEEDSIKGRYLAFRVHEEDYGIEIQYVTEIVGIQKIAAVPDMPEFIKGVINLRGQVIPVMDIRIRFRLPLKEYNERTCVIVVNYDDHPIGLVVDSVNEVTSIPEDSVCEPPRVAHNESARYIRGIGKVGDEVRIILDVSKLLYGNDVEAVAQVANS